MKKYYGFRYASGKTTTCGDPNKCTGNYSIAGYTIVFAQKDQLQEWVNEENTKPSGLGGGNREQVTKQELRGLCAGMSEFQFEELIENLNYDD